MKTSSSISFLLVTLAARECLGGAAAPQISIGLNTATGATSKLGGIEPSVTWKTAGTVGDLDVSGGVDVTITDVDSFKETVWGKVQRSINGFGLSARGQMSVTRPEIIDLDLECSAPTSTNLALAATATTDGSFSVSTLKAAQTLDALGGTIKAVPKYSFESSKTDLSVAYAPDGAQNSVQVDVSSNGKSKLSLMQKINPSNIIRPSITNEGQLDIEHESVGDFGSVKTTYKPNHHVNVQWSDGGWTATLNAPMSGYYSFEEGVSVSVKTKVNVDSSSLF